MAEWKIKKSKPRKLFIGSLIVTIFSIILMSLGIILPLVIYREDESIPKKSDIIFNSLILIGSILFGIAGGMLTNIFTVYDLSPNEVYLRLDRIIEKVDRIEEQSIHYKKNEIIVINDDPES